MSMAAERPGFRKVLRADGVVMGEAEPEVQRDRDNVPVLPFRFAVTSQTRTKPAWSPMIASGNTALDVRQMTVERQAALAHKPLTSKRMHDAVRRAT